MLRPILALFVLPFLLLPGSRSTAAAAEIKQKHANSQTETIEKLLVDRGSAVIEVDLGRLNNTRSVTERPSVATVRFAVAPGSFFPIIVNNDVLRGALPGAIGLIPQNAADFPAPLISSLSNLILEKRQGDTYDLVLRDRHSGFVFFNIVGHHYDYDAHTKSLSINDGSLLLSDQFAKELGRPGEAHAMAGKIFVRSDLSQIEIRTLLDGELRTAVLPPLRDHAVRSADQPQAVTAVPGPDVIVGDLLSVEQPSGTGGINFAFVGLGVGTTSCNNGDQEINWLGLPNNDHPVIAQNLYRMSGGTSNSERFEQVGQSWLKHSFFATQEDACGFGCVPHPTPTPAGDGSHLGVGCSDPYSANLNYTQSFLGSRAWVQPFTGFYPRGDSATPPRDHTGHIHTGTSHRLTVAMSDLNTTLNTNASYFAEAQYVTPHEYAWCQAHAGQCNMNNNASYRQFSVSSTNQTNFTFLPVDSTVRMQPAIAAWTGATVNQVEPAPGSDGIAFVGYKVTNPSPGVWHYEYAVYNQDLDRAIQSFSVPLDSAAMVSNIGFHAPPQEPGFANDGTLGNTGYSSAAWTSTQTSSSLTWISETFAQNQNANAIRWGTLYNFRFDANSPPQTANATVGFFKTGSPITVAVQGPSAPTTPTPSPTPATVNISGNISYCSNPSFDPVPGVTLTLTGDVAGSTQSDSSGNYTFSSVPSGGNYTVTPSKGDLTPGAAGINTIDVVAVQRHFLNQGTPLSGCHLTAADVNGINGVNTVDVVAIQRFFLAQSTGIANTGKYHFNPANRSYSGITTDQTGQNYDTLIFGDVAPGFVH